MGGGDEGKEFTIRRNRLVMKAHLSNRVRVFWNLFLK